MLSMSKDKFTNTLNIYRIAGAYRDRGVLNFHFGIGVRPEGPQMGA